MLPKILFVDIEASNLSASMGYCLAIGYKWAHEKKTKIMSIADYPGRKSTDDAPMLREFEKVFREADLVVHHFGDYYDIPFLQTRRFIHGMKPMPRVATVDTWRIAKKRLKFHSNRLDAILKALGCPYAKTALDGNAWIDASAGDRKALKYIVHHCKMDVLVLEWVYNKIKPVWDQHPAIYGKLRCKACGGAKFRSEGIRPTTEKIYRRLVCVNCGLSKKGDVVQ